MHRRICKVLIMLAAISAAGFIYYILSCHGITLPCVFYEITGLYCPGCGATRMCTNLLKFNFYKAFRSNQVSFFIIPMLAVIFSRQLYCYIKYGKPKNEKWMTVLCIIALIALLIFGIIRNIPHFYFLRPE